MQVKGPIDWFEILEITGDTIRVRLKTFEGEEHELELARGDCVRATIPIDSSEEMGENYYPQFENYISQSLPPELVRLAADSTADKDGAYEETDSMASQSQPTRRSNTLLDKLGQLEPRLRDLSCIECGIPEQLVVTREGIVSMCHRCGSCQRIDADLLQRLVDELDIRCFACGEGTLKSEATEYANILKCQNPTCASVNSWRGVSDRLQS